MVNINWVSLYHPSRYMCASVSVAMMLFCDGHVVTSGIDSYCRRPHFTGAQTGSGSGIAFLCLTDVLCLPGAPLRLPVARSVPFSASRVPPE